MGACEYGIYPEIFSCEVLSLGGFRPKGPKKGLKGVKKALYSGKYPERRKCEGLKVDCKSVAKTGKSVM